MRIDEVFLLQHQDIEISIENNDHKMKIKLNDRKTSNNLSYKRNPSEPCVDPGLYYMDYYNYIKHLNKATIPTNLVFPRISKGSYNLTSKCQATDMLNRLKQTLDKLGVSNIDISSHSIRKGGARYALLFRKRHLDKIKYWADGASMETTRLLESIYLKKWII